MRRRCAILKRKKQMVSLSGSRTMPHSHASQVVVAPLAFEQSLQILCSEAMAILTMLVENRKVTACIALLQHRALAGLLSGQDARWVAAMSGRTASRCTTK